MNINLRQFVLLVLDSVGETVSGKTYLQKLCFFTGLKSGNHALGFRPHYYGPYSDPISTELSFLKSAGYISEQRRGTGFADASGWEVARYDYSVTDEGRAAADRLRTIHPADSNAVNEAVKAVIEAGPLDYMALSIAAKTYWIVSENGSTPLRVTQVSDQASLLKWNISAAQIQAATTFLQKLGLVRVVPHTAAAN